MLTVESCDLYRNRFVRIWSTKAWISPCRPPILLALPCKPEILVLRNLQAIVQQMDDSAQSPMLRCELGKTRCRPTLGQPNGVQCYHLLNRETGRCKPKNLDQRGKTALKRGQEAANAIYCPLPACRALPRLATADARKKS